MLPDGLEGRSQAKAGELRYDLACSGAISNDNHLGEVELVEPLGPFEVWGGLG